MSWTQINSKMIEVPASDGVLARHGSMLAYKGEVVFAPTAGSGGVGGFVGRMVRGEQVSMMQVQGQGTVLLGHAGLNIEILDGGGEQIIVEADRLLAYDNSKQAATRSLSQASGGGGGGGLRGALRGAVTGAVTGQGMWTTVLTGPGGVAVLSHGPVFSLPVGGGEVKVDPQAFVCAVGQVKVEVSANVGFREMTGRGSGEGIQLKCSGSGKVYVQASEQKL
ncbi:hypothetical protein DSM112329_02676 [Paraconexibacter sp. AEG42_29]|uniref:AIM24 family protein n=1 Tax=Paraconexibacter sp. AEG42_29 TaxID=2997339 RepID=A0AAU7AVZ4_9ACTN